MPALRRRAPRRPAGAAAPRRTAGAPRRGLAQPLSRDRATALLWPERDEATAQGGAYVSPSHLAYVYAGLGDSERALDPSERAVAERAGPAYGIKGSFLLAPLRAHPRFRALLRQQMQLA